jgi:3,4-dihydroxy 2-butanone 4-phosphate synthase/GTP cyclohydrolase II
MDFVSIPDAVNEIRSGRMVIAVDDDDRENEGDLTVAAAHVTRQIVNFMAVHGRGLICLALTGERREELNLPLMSRLNTSRFGTGFCETVDALEGVTTGVSAHDRARTIQQAIDPKCPPSDLARPGHMFPARAQDGGVLVREGQTEASVDLARLAGLHPSGVICEVMNDDGSMARVPQLQQFCRRHGMAMTSVADLIRYRLATERFHPKDLGNGDSDRVRPLPRDLVSERDQSGQARRVGAGKRLRRFASAGPRRGEMRIRRFPRFRWL